MDKWEYTKCYNEKDLAKLGMDGWEAYTYSSIGDKYMLKRKVEN